MLDYAPEELHDVGADVLAVGARVLARQPDLDDALAKRLLHALHYLVRIVRAELAARMLRLAVRALVQTPANKHIQYKLHVHKDVTIFCLFECG